MNQYNRMRQPGNRRAKSFPRMEETFVERPARHFFDGQHHMLRIQANHADALVIEQPHLLAEQQRDIVRVFNRPRFRLAASQPRRQRKGRLESDGLRLSHALDLRQLADGCATQRLQRPEVHQQKFSELEYGPSGGSGAQEDGEELGCLQRVRSLVQQSLPRPFRRREFAHRNRRHRPPPYTA